MVRPKKKRMIKEKVLALEEVEAFRLVDGENLSQEEAAKNMNISQVITQGKAMRIKGGEIIKCLEEEEV